MGSMVACELVSPVEPGAGDHFCGYHGAVPTPPRSAGLDATECWPYAPARLHVSSKRCGPDSNRHCHLSCRSCGASATNASRRRRLHSGATYSGVKWPEISRYSTSSPNSMAATELLPACSHHAAARHGLTQPWRGRSLGLRLEARHASRFNFPHSLRKAERLQSAHRPSPVPTRSTLWNRVQGDRSPHDTVVTVIREPSAPKE